MKRATEKRELTVATTGYLVLAVLSTYPAVVHLSDRLIGAGDASLFTWNMWWLKYSLVSLIHPFCHNFVYFPAGLCNYLHTWNLPVTLASIPLQPFLSLVTVYNLSALLSFVLAGLGMFRLGRYLGFGFWGALVAGTAYSFCPYHFAKLEAGHLNLMHYQWIPFFVQSLLAADEAGWRIRKALAAAGWLVLIALTSWYYFVFCVMASLLLILYRARCDIRFLLLRARGTAVIILISVLVLSPLISGMVWEAGQGLPAETIARRDNADLASFVIPGERSLFGRLVASGGGHWRANNVTPENFIPWTAWLLAGVGWFTCRREIRCVFTGWLVMFFVLSLGYHLRTGGELYESVTLPYGLLADGIPGAGIIRSPIRFHIMTWFAGCLFLAAGVHHLSGRLRSDKLMAGFATLVCGLLVGESLGVPFVMNPLPVSPFYTQLQHNSSPDEGVMDLHYFADALYFQTVHHRKVMGRDGMVNRVPQSALEQYEVSPIREIIAENDYYHYGTGRPADILAAAPAMAEESTFVALGYLQGPGRLCIETSRPHDIWLGERRRARGGLVTELEVADAAEQRFRLSTSIRRGAGDTVLLRPLADPGPAGRPQHSTTVGIRPYFADPPASEGLFCVLYPYESPSAPDAETMRRMLRQAGFRWIIVPFYGNSHYVETILELTPAYEDHLLTAYRLE
ncbi:MAG: hypothetical protein JXQ27_11895 [Acidobacteria bacterium]|nr:hypothetical protein [Acidobacteriota bacterium]